MGRLKYSIEYCRRMAKNKNGECLFDKYINCKTKMRWKCSKNHIWYSSLDNILHGNHWCPHCAGNARITIEKCRQLAAEKNGECLFVKCANSTTKMKWKCHDGHIFEKTYGSIKAGSWCPICSGSINEEKCRFILEELTNKKFPPDWKVLGSGHQLDGYCKDRNLAFEYNGRQHYEFSPHWHKSMDNFKKRQEADQYKSVLCKQKNIIKIDIPYFESKTDTCLEEFIKKNLIKNKINFNDKKINWFKFIGLPSKLECIQKIANKKNINCISSTFINIKEKLKFHCRVCKYTWSTQGSHIKSGHGCPNCAGRPEYTIKDMQKLAENLGGIDGKCLSTEYVNEVTKLKWQCKCGNIWESTPHSIKSGHWCPECGKKKSWKNRKTKWTDEENAVLSDTTKTVKEIQLLLSSKRTINSIYHQRSRLKLNLDKILSIEKCKQSRIKKKNIL